MSQSENLWYKGKLQNYPSIKTNSSFFIMIVIAIFITN